MLRSALSVGASAGFRTNNEAFPARRAVQRRGVPGRPEPEKRKTRWERRREGWDGNPGLSRGGARVCRGRAGSRGRAGRGSSQGSGRALGRRAACVRRASQSPQLTLNRVLESKEKHFLAKGSRGGLGCWCAGRTRRTPDAPGKAFADIHSKTARTSRAWGRSALDTHPPGPFWRGRSGNPAEDSSPADDQECEAGLTRRVCAGSSRIVSGGRREARSR